MAEKAGTPYPSPGMRRIVDLGDAGSLLELEDHSRWEVCPGHEIYTVHWEADAPVVVVPGGVSEYPYDLINRSSAERVPVRFKGFHETPDGWSFID